MYEAYQLRPYNPDDLYQKRGNYDLFDEMRQDEQIAAILTLKKFFIINGQRDIQCEDEKIKEFIEYALDNCMDVMLEEAMFDILSAIDFGFSLTEKVWQKVSTKEYGEKIVLKSLKTRAPHSFEIHTDDFGNVTTIKQEQRLTSWVDIDPSKFIHYTFQEEFGNPYGNSELNLGIYRAWWSKNALIKMWNIALERFGAPTAVGTYPSSLFAEKDNLKKALSNIQTKTAIVIPEGVVLDLLKGENIGDAFKQAIDFYNTAISRKALVPDLMGMSGQETGGGSYSLGQAHFNLFYNNIQSERKRLERTLNKEIITPLVKWNFGDKVEAKLVLQNIDVAERREDLKIWLEAVKTGKVPVNNEAVNWFLKQVNAPEITEQEFNEMEKEKEEMREEISGDVGGENKGDIGKPGGEDGENDKMDDGDRPVKKEEMELREYVSNRELSKYEKQVDFVKIENTLDTLEIDFAKDLSKAIRLGINGIIDDIQRKKIIEGKRYDTIGKLKIGNLDQIISIYKDHMGRAAQAGRLQARQESVFEGTDNAATDWLDTQSIYSATRDGQEVIDRVQSIVVQSMRSEWSVADTIAKMREALTDYTGDTSAARLKRIIRTSTSAAYNEGRAELFRETADRIIGYEFSAVMDSHTSDICRHMDGKIIEPDKMAMWNPPLHFNCRSVLIAIHDTETVESYFTPPTIDDRLEVDDWGFFRLKPENKNV